MSREVPGEKGILLLCRLLLYLVLAKEGADRCRMGMLLMESQSGRGHSFLEWLLKDLSTQLGAGVIWEVIEEAWTQALLIHFLSSSWLPIFYLPPSPAFRVSFPTCPGDNPPIFSVLLEPCLVRGSFLVWCCHNKAVMMIEGKRPTDRQQKVCLTSTDTETYRNSQTKQETT